MKSVSAFFTLVLLIAFTSLSTAQTDWTKYPGNPVFTSGSPGEWDDYSLWQACVLYDGSTYHMWYGGHDGTTTRIGYATTPDGITWTRYAGNPVLDVGEPGSWEDGGLGAPYVMFDGSIYHMWYAGSDGTYSRIGYATSPDRVTWTKHPANPIMDMGTAESWEEMGVWNHCVLFEGSTYHMWYDGWSVSGTGQIGYATSPDGISWTPYEDNPVLKIVPGYWESQRVEYPEVFFDGSVYHMWYTGGKTTSLWHWEGIGYATSADGITWTKSESNPVLTKDAGNWDSQWVAHCRVLWDSTTSQFQMWYGGGSSDWYAKIGYATAPLNLNVPGDYATIQAAIDAAHDGNVVLVDEGTYYENINFKGKAITVASHFYMDGNTSHISKTIIDGSQPANPDSGSVVLLISGEDTTSVLMGFTITNGTGSKTQFTEGENKIDSRAGGGIACYNSGGRFISNIIIDNSVTSNDVTFGGGFAAGEYGSDAWVILENNHIMNNSSSSVVNSYAGGIGIICNGKLIDNVITNNSCNSSESYAVGGGIRVSSMPDDPRFVTIKDNQVTHNVVQGIGIESENYFGGYGGGIQVWGSKVLIIDNKISQNKVTGIGTGHGTGAGIYMYLAENGSEINGNKIFNNKCEATDSNYGGGINLGQSEDISITNNIITGNTGSHGAGIRLNYTNAAIINNTIVNNSASTFGGGLYSSNNSNPIVFNTIFWDNNATTGSQIYGSGYVRYSDILGGWSGEGNINTDPLFVPGDSLYHLMGTTDTSSCLNTGIDSIRVNNKLYYAPNTDHGGNVRPQPIGTRPDMGAWESPVVNSLQELRGLPFPKTISLKQNYPNPFNPLTNIEFSIPKAEFVSLKIYNLLGQQVLTLVSEKLRAGNYKYTWNAAGFASGIYYFQLTSGGFQDFKKMILLR